MRLREYKTIVTITLLFGISQAAFGNSAEDFVRRGNRLYDKGNFNDALKEYDQALIDQPQVLEPKFNKANCYFQLDDLTKAIELYNEVAADSKDMELVAKAKYNLGNCHFQMGLKQKDSDLQKALEQLQASIVDWRGVLDINPEHKNAARNIEVARLIIKDIIDQLNRQKQQQQGQQQGQQGQQQQDQQQGQQGQQKQEQQQGQSQQDKQDQQEQQGQTGPEKDPKKSEDQKQSSDPNDGQKAASEQEIKQVVASDMTAQEILDKERRQKERRQMLRTAGRRKVDKDW